MKPNILLIMADQLAPRFLASYGSPVAKAPNLDRLAAEGVVFDNAYSNSPLCVPARAVALSGLLPSRSGVYDNAAEFSAEIPTFAHYARLQGYRTCIAGKLHAIGPDQLHGFEERLTTDIYPADFGWTPDWRLRGRERIDWWYHNMSSVKEAGTAAITNQLEYDDEVAFLANRQLFDWSRYQGDEPFLLKVSFTHPHDPYVNRRRFFDLYSDSDIRRRPSAPFPIPSSISMSSASTTWLPWTTTRSPMMMCAEPAVAIAPASPMSTASSALSSTRWRPAAGSTRRSSSSPPTTVTSWASAGSGTRCRSGRPPPAYP
jgi:choline-sulfatase